MVVPDEVALLSLATRSLSSVSATQRLPSGRYVGKYSRRCTYAIELSGTLEAQKEARAKQDGKQ